MKKWISLVVVIALTAIGVNRHYRNKRDDYWSKRTNTLAELREAYKSYGEQQANYRTCINSPGATEARCYPEKIELDDAHARLKYADADLKKIRSL